MQAMQIDRFGGPEVFRLRDVPVPKSESGQLVLRSPYASINPADWKARAGLLPHLATFPMTIGMDCTGVIVAARSIDASADGLPSTSLEVVDLIQSRSARRKAIERRKYNAR